MSVPVYWDNNPPPPGTEFDYAESLPLSNQMEETEKSNDCNPDAVEPPDEEIILRKDKKDKESSYGRSRRYRSRSGSLDHKYYRKRSRSHSRRRRRRSRDKRKRSRSRSNSRSDSRDRKRKSRSSRSRSRTRRRRHASYSRSRSRSRSESYRRNKKSHRRHSQSRSRSRSHSSRSHRRDRYRSSSRSPKVRNEVADSEYSGGYDGDLIAPEDMILESEQPEVNPVPFKNDGSFLEMFKRMQEMQQQQEQQQQIKEEPGASSEPKKPVVPVFGKRRGGKVLKTGIVQKVRHIEDDPSTASDPWSVYMKEVRKYKEVHCDDDSKTRPLVK